MRIRDLLLPWSLLTIRSVEGLNVNPVREGSGDHQPLAASKINRLSITPQLTASQTKPPGVQDFIHLAPSRVVALVPDFSLHFIEDLAAPVLEHQLQIRVAALVHRSGPFATCLTETPPLPSSPGRNGRVLGQFAASDIPTPRGWSPDFVGNRFPTSWEG